MDLGATVCIRSTAAVCGVSAGAALRRTTHGRQHEIPTPRPRPVRRKRAVVMLLAQLEDGSILLERRAERGVWGGLWSPPQFPSADAARLYAATRLVDAEVEPQSRTVLRHAFTHLRARDISAARPLLGLERGDGWTADALVQPRIPGALGSSGSRDRTDRRTHMTPDRALRRPQERSSRASSGHRILDRWASESTRRSRRRAGRAGSSTRSC